MTNTLSVKGLSKSFGANKVIDGISFDVPEGSIFGFIGANGAGKTTTMKMILGLLPSDNGEIFVCGEKVSFGATKTNRYIGYLPDVPEFYGYMRPKEYLRLCGEIVGLDAVVNSRRIWELLDMVGLSEVNKKISAFSRGMKQRLGMAQALLNEPKLLICDEPTSALDPMGRKEILDTLKQARDKTTVIFSTHILSDVERICDRVAVLSGGHIALSGTLAELRTKHKLNSIFIEFASATDKGQFVAAATLLMKDAKSVDMELTLRVTDMEAAQREILRILSANDILPLKLEVLEPTIESLYLEVAG
ncbi:MAG: ABC-2 type transport system ATP-binding protein [Bacillota bacterium]|nr:MAG: ABC-2 type transport system ATP-binding protein [Bacillota bacterium]